MFGVVIVFAVIGQSAGGPAVGGGGCMRVIMQLEYTLSNTTLKETNGSKTIEVSTI